MGLARGIKRAKAASKAAGDMLLGFGGEVGAKGDRKNLFSDLLAYREIALFVSKVGKALL